VEVAEGGRDTSLLRGPAGLWTAIDKAGFAKRAVEGRADPTRKQDRTISGVEQHWIRNGVLDSGVLVDETSQHR
jgi:hypothetical protein